MIHCKESKRCRHLITAYAGDQRLAGAEFTEGERKVFGQGADCHVPLSVEDIAERHLEISVQDGVLRVTNLQQSGLWLNGALIQGTEEFDPKDTLLLGAHTVLLYEIREEEEEKEAFSLDPADEVTGASFALPGQAATEAEPGSFPVNGDTAPGRTVDTSLLDDDEELTGELRGGLFTSSGTCIGTDGESDTRQFAEEDDALEPGGDPTLLLDFDAYRELNAYDEVTELMFPDAPEEKKDEDRVRIRGNRREALGEVAKALLLLAIIGSALYWFLYSRVLSQEKVDWPRRNGQLAIAATPAFGGGKVHRGCDLNYPDVSNAVITEIDGRIEVVCRVGSHGSVPLRLTYLEWRDRLLLKLDRDQALHQAVDRLHSLPGEWVFDYSAISQRFWGQSGAIPFTHLPYHREEGGRGWNGYAAIGRHSDGILLYTVEIPSAESERAGALLNYFRYLDPHPEFITGHWEPEFHPEPFEPASWIRNIRASLTRNAPQHFVSVQRELHQFLTQARWNANLVAMEEGREALRQLNRQVDEWHRRQQLAYQQAYYTYQDKQLRALNRETREALRGMDDLRFFIKLTAKQP